MSRHLRFCIGMAAFASAACLVSAAARADVLPYTVNTGDGNGAETYVRGGTFAGTNFGGALTLRAINEGADLSSAAKVYLRFDLSEVQEWDGFAQNASVEIPFQDTGAGTTPPLMEWDFSLYALDDGPAELFDELAINWNNAPANNTASADGLGAGATLLTPFGVQGKGTAIKFYSAALDQLINSDTNDVVTLVVVRNTVAAAGADYEHAVAAPQEAFAGPRLTVVPEPAAVAGLAFAGGLLLPRRRRP